MHIVCPHCTTSYAIQLSSLGTNGRTVRCSRCKETWVAHPEDAVEEVPIGAMAGAHPADGRLEADDEWNSSVNEAREDDAPIVDSPSIASDWPDAAQIEQGWSAARPAEDDESGETPHQSWF